MAGYFKKRKGAQGPNKNEQKVMRNRNSENPGRLAGVIGSKFPFVKVMRINLTFMDAQQRLLDEKKMALGPTDPLVFNVPCPGRCGRGSFDFGAKIAETATNKLAVSECGAKCPEPLYAAATETCSCEIKCRIEIDYLPSAI